MGAAVWNNSVVRALDQGGCPVCRVLADGERRDVAAFRRDGRFVPEARARFLASGGYCRRHAWLLHAQLRAGPGGSAIADLYGALLRRDLRRLRALTGPDGGEGPPASLPCPVCERRSKREAETCALLLETLERPQTAAAYGRSDGACVAHLEALLRGSAALVKPALTRLLAEQGERRLAETLALLERYDRSRDYRHEEAGEREEAAWTDVVRLYVGEEETDASYAGAS